MATYKPRVISLTKRPGQTFGFYLRAEQSEEGHLIRCLELGGPAELAGMKDGDRILRVSGTFVDNLNHSEVVELVRNGGASVTFHILDESSYKQAKALGVNLSDPQSTPITNGVAKEAPKPKLCYLVKSSSGYGFSIRSAAGEQGVYFIEVIPGGVADRAGVQNKDQLLEVNGENVEKSTHDQVVEKIKQAGNDVVFLLADEETKKFYENKQAKLSSWSATVKYLPLQPRIIKMTRGSDGYGFLLRQEPNQIGHFTIDIDRGSPAQKAGLKEMDRVVAVNGKDVTNTSYEQVVDKIKQSGDKCCLLVVDKDTDQMYKKGNVPPMLFWEEMNETISPPSYTEAMKMSASSQEKKEELKPKLCRMEKTSSGYGFHLNGIEGVCGQYIQEVVKGGAADKAGLEDDDIVVEVGGVNVEQSTHAEVVEMIRESGNSLEMLVASRDVYKQLKAKEVTITCLLLEETTRSQHHKADTPETSKKNQNETRPVTPPKAEKQRTASVSSSSSEESFDESL
ncbi:Na(+)/H(+) exchange regulatory cofactor NHE-RF3 [Kryptolebias marmoratus]|uniref:PDZ domain containing 1 n=1 Tax=Kryptolebias marmoratus TaxID=37003 RepID=A0A3Q3BIF3_KRYMA|nr:Na(+)/H(+) exchange regulatory cofactor NHE-RF3 [Kryptolebias marmoratus]